MTIKSIRLNIIYKLKKSSFLWYLHSILFFYTLDEADIRGQDEHRHILPNNNNYMPMAGTAFSRPVPSSIRDPCSLSFAEESCRGNVTNPSLSLSPLKHYTPFNSASFDRPTYLSQYGLNSYNDIIGTGSSLTATRMQPYTDSHSQSFSHIPFSASMPQPPSAYWTSDSRPHTYHDHYTPYSYNKLTTPYETLNKGSFLRGAAYQDVLNRATLESHRPYYRSHHDYNQGKSCYFLWMLFLPIGSYTCHPGTWIFKKYRRNMFSV